MSVGMVYGYVNRYKGENEKFLDGMSIDKIVYNDKPGFDFSFAKKTDKIIFKEYKSVADTLIEFIDFCRFAFESNVKYLCMDGPVDTESAFGKLFNDILAGLSNLNKNYWEKN